jgi:TonB family protein
MRDTLYRLTAPILDRIPDISHQPKGRQVSIGFAASLLFHLLLLLLALLFGLVLPKHALLEFAKPKPKLEEIELTVVPPAPQEEMRLVPLEEIEHPKPFLDSRGLATADKAPDKAIFESDADMKAASELPALGNLPLPSQAGRVEPEFPAFADQQMSLGRTAVPFSQNVAAATPPAPPTPPTPAELEKMPPTPPTEAPPAEQKAPPTPLKEVTKPSEDEIALAAKSASPPLAPPMPRMRATLPVAMLATPVPQPPQPKTKPGYQPQLEKTRIEGNISNRGRNAVDAIGTPLGRYKKAVNDAVGSRWYHYTEQKTSIIAPGSVRVTFAVDGKGRIVSVRSEGNTSNASFSDLCERAVRDAEIAPPPPDLMTPLLDGKLDFTITFTFHTF